MRNLSDTSLHDLQWELNQIPHPLGHKPSHYLFHNDICCELAHFAAMVPVCSHCTAQISLSGRLAFISYNR